MKNTKRVIDLIEQERKRQIEKEGWTPEHDDRHTDGELAEAAATYCASCNLSVKLPAMVDGQEVEREVTVLRHTRWPFDWDWFKPTPNDRIRELVKAGAMIVAEIERLLREDPERIIPHELSQGFLKNEDNESTEETKELDGPVDWMNIPQIKSLVETLGTLRDAEGVSTQRTGSSLMPKKGKVYWLEVKCEEPELLQAVFHSMFTKRDGSNSFVPGASLQKINFEDPKEDGIIEYLERQIEEIRRQRELRRER